MYIEQNQKSTNVRFCQHLYFYYGHAAIQYSSVRSSISKTRALGDNRPARSQRPDSDWHDKCHHASHHFSPYL